MMVRGERTGIKSHASGGPRQCQVVIEYNPSMPPGGGNCGLLPSRGSWMFSGLDDSQKGCRYAERSPPGDEGSLQERVFPKLTHQISL
jgi:hypothetical protein